MPDKRASIQLRDPAAIGVVVERARKERRSGSAALAVIVLEWAEVKSMIRHHRATARRAKSLPEGNQNTTSNGLMQRENPPTISLGADNKETCHVGDAKDQFQGREPSGECSKGGCPDVDEILSGGKQYDFAAIVRGKKK